MPWGGLAHKELNIHCIPLHVLRSVAFYLNKIYVTLKYITNELLVYDYIFKINAFWSKQKQLN